MNGQTTPPVLPLFAQIEATLRARILEQRLTPGEKLPSEQALEREFGVSRITVRQALSVLHASGLIQKINGKGSFVTRPGDRPPPGGLTGVYEHMRAQGREAHGRTLSVRAVKAAAPVARALRVEVGTPLTAVNGLRLVDGEAFAVGTTYGPADLMRAILRENMEANDLMHILESRLGFRIERTYTEASAVHAGRTRARQLDVGEDAPLLRMRFTPQDVAGRLLCYSEIYFRGDQFRYKAVIRR